MGYGQKVASCNYVWYLEGATDGILVDCGATAELSRQMGTSDEDIQPLEEGLGKLGVALRDIKTVILTHLHWDHVALASRFPDARFFVQKKEFDFALNPHPAVASSFRKEFFVDLNLQFTEGDQEIMDGVNVLFTPGHSPGGQSVAIDTPKGLAIITGFCCTLDNFSPPPEAKAKGLEIVAPGIHTNVLEAYDSALRVKDTAKTIIPLHDPKFLGVDRIP
jgi:glyoxylase-like metal-dependent hydrolase (beta-lactamase superfamily II)